MSEQLRNHESDRLAGSEQTEQYVGKAAQQRAETAAEATRSLESIRHDIAEHAQTKQELQLPKSEKVASAAPAFINRQLKVMARTRLLKRIRTSLPVQDRALSRVIHQPIVDNVSELAGKTVARPSGLLSGGIFALLGSSIFLYIDKHAGYHYNFLLWFMCFVGGFAIGLLVEALVVLINRVRS